MMIPFNVTPKVGTEAEYILKAINGGALSGDGEFTKKCHQWFEQALSCPKVLLTPSCTHALEMAAILLNIQEGDEVIMPSYTFVSTANAFVLRGAKIVFVDVRPDTMNIDEKLIEKAITSKTKAIVPVHYAGVPCEMDVIMDIAKRHNLFVIEDAAQGVDSYYKGKALGTIGHIGAYSFHATKNITSGGEGGLLLINDSSLELRAEIIREKGTNRSLFFRGMVDKYSWVDVGSSYLASELQAAYLYAQLLALRQIQDDRLASWDFYKKQLTDQGNFQVPPSRDLHANNAHMFYIKLQNLEERTLFFDNLKEKGVSTAFHYVPLHSSLAGKQFGTFYGKDEYTTKESERLLRLPLWYGITREMQEVVINEIKKLSK